MSGKINPMPVKMIATWRLFLLGVILAGCAPGAAPMPTPTTTSSLTPSVTSSQTSTKTVIPSPTQTPPTLPGVFQSSLLYPGDSPHTYIQEPCQYLRDKWTSTNALPGTVVMVVMFHAVTQGPASTPDQISEEDFRQLMQALHDKGFEAITTEQLVHFLEANRPIPPRSVLLTADDRHNKQYFDILFRPYWENWGWPVVNAWISTDLSSAALWQEQVDLHNEGWVDYQAHGVVHNLTMGPNATDEYIFSELQGSIDRFGEHFGKKPIAIIWPGGIFTRRGVEMARELGYRLGFTISPRGPILYNWVPLGDGPDPRRPSWLPEGEMGDPLLVLPRYWDTDAIIHMDEVILTGQEAAAQAEANKGTELAYYDIVCSPSLGPIP